MRHHIGGLLVALTLLSSVWVWGTTRQYRAEACSRARAFHAFLVSDAAARDRDAEHARKAAAVWRSIERDGPAFMVGTAGQLARLRLADAARSAGLSRYWRSLDGAGLAGC